MFDVRACLETTIISRNKAHFAQAKDTPWRKPPFDHINSDTAYDMKTTPEGTPFHCHDSPLLETKTVAAILQDTLQAGCPTWSPETSFQEFLSGILHWREATSTSPSGRHLGVYKALAVAHCNSSGEFGSPDPTPGSPPTTQDQATTILHAIHALAATAARRGFYLHRWIYVTNVMIYKKPGCIELNRLRVIHLFEADFNLMVGILFGRRAMFHQSKHRLIHPGQYGQPGGECQDAAISKVLHNLLSTLTHTAMGQFESDATACFDRVVMEFALLCFKANGAPLHPLQMWERTLHHIVHRVKTAYGLSSDFYRYVPDSPIIGPGQGS